METKEPAFDAVLEMPVGMCAYQMAIFMLSPGSSSDCSFLRMHIAGRQQLMAPVLRGLPSKRVTEIVLWAPVWPGTALIVAGFCQSGPVDFSVLVFEVSLPLCLSYQ